MAANTFILLFCIRMVDGFRAGIQRGRRYKNSYEDQPCIFLADTNTAVLLAGDLFQLATFGCILGSIYFRDLGWFVYTLVVFKRQVEDSAGVSRIGTDRITNAF